MKKPLNIDGAKTGADDKIITLKVSYYPNGNMKLAIEVNGEEFLELSVDIRDQLELNCVAINPKQEYWVKTLIYQNNLGSFFERYYLSIEDGGTISTIYYLNRFSLLEFSKEEYDKYVFMRAEKHIKGLSRAELTKRYYRYHIWALQHQNKPIYKNKKKPKYKCSFKDLYHQRTYRHKKDLIIANLPKGMRAEIEKYGEKASVVLKRKLFEYLDECEKKGEQ